jgi:hypothetical protein
LNELKTFILFPAKLYYQGIFIQGNVVIADKAGFGNQLFRLDFILRHYVVWSSALLTFFLIFTKTILRRRKMVKKTHAAVYSAGLTIVGESSPLEDPYGSKSQTASKKAQSLCSQCL